MYKETGDASALVQTSAAERAAENEPGPRCTPWPPPTPTHWVPPQGESGVLGVLSCLWGWLSLWTALCRSPQPLSVFTPLIS